MFLKRFFIIFVYVFVINLAFSQSQKIDSLSIKISDDSLQNDIQKIFIDSINALNFENDRLNKSKENYNLGLKYFEENNLEKSLEYFDNSIFYDSTFAKAYFFRAKCLENLNDSLALISYFKAFKLDSLDIAPLYRIAKIYEKESFDEAINTYNLIINLKNKEHKAFYKLATLYYIHDSINLAIENYSKSISIKKKARAFNDRAGCYRLIGKNDLAFNDYKLAISIDPNIAFIYNNLASLYRKIGDYENALENYSIALKKDENYFLAYNNRGSLKIELGNYNGALQDINKCISINSSYAPAYHNKGTIFYYQKKFSEAILLFDKAILLNPNYGKAFLNRGIVKQIIRDELGACKDWMKSRELGINISNTYLVYDCN